MIDALSGIQTARYTRAATASAPTSEPEAASPPGAAMSAFEAFAKSYDIHSMTPREIDEMAKAMPIEKDGDLEVKMMLLTRGEEWMTHLAETGEQVFGVDTSETLEARLSTPIDLLDSFRTSKEISERHGDPTEAVDKAIDYLQQMDARRMMPEGGVLV